MKHRDSVRLHIVLNFWSRLFILIYRALIERDDSNSQQTIRIDLFDNGSGSDLIANDGIYSRYFTKYDGKNERYSLKCQLKGKLKVWKTFQSNDITIKPYETRTGHKTGAQTEEPFCRRGFETRPTHFYKKLFSPPM